MSERLRLEAEFADRGVAAGLRKISGELKEVRRTPGMEAASKWMEEFREKTTGFVKEGGGVAGVMSGLGLAGLTAGASLAELVAHFKELGEQALAMKEIGRETGLTVDQLAALNKAAEGFDVNGGKMQAAIAAFKAQMPQFLSGADSPLRNAIQGQFPKLSEALKADSNDTQKQIEDIFRFAEQQGLQKNPQLQKQYFDLFFPGMGGEIEKLEGKGPGAFMKAFADALRSGSGSTSEIIKAAEAFHEATKDFNDSLKNLENSAAPTILKQMADVMREANRLFDAYQHPDDAAKDMAERLKKENDAGKSRFGPGLVPGGKDTVDAITGAGDAMKKAWEWFYPHFAIEPHKDAPKSPYGGLDRNAFKKSSFDGSVQGGLLHRASYLDSMGLADLKDPIALGTKSGVLAAFRELMAEHPPGSGGDGDGGQVVEAAYGGGRRRRARGYGGGGGALPENSGNGSAHGFGSEGQEHHRRWAQQHGFTPGARVDARGFGAHGGSWWNAERTAHAVDRLMKEAGLSEAGAEGLVSRWANVEATAGPKSRNPITGALGIGQWLGARQHGFTSDFDSQIGHAVKELNEFENGGSATRALRSATTALQGAVGASRYERAEGYNPHSGADNWTAKSLAGARHVHDLRQMQEHQRRSFDLPRLREQHQRQLQREQMESPNGTLTVHLRDPRGYVKRTSFAMSGPIKGKVRTWPTMTYPSEDS